MNVHQISLRGGILPRYQPCKVGISWMNLKLAESTLPESSRVLYTWLIPSPFPCRTLALRWWIKKWSISRSVDRLSNRIPHLCVYTQTGLWRNSIRWVIDYATLRTATQIDWCVGIMYRYHGPAHWWKQVGDCRIGKSVGWLGNPSDVQKTWWQMWWNEKALLSHPIFSVLSKHDISRSILVTNEKNALSLFQYDRSHW